MTNTLPIDIERLRLSGNKNSIEIPCGLEKFNFYASCKNNSIKVVDNIKKVLSVILDNISLISEQNDEKHWERILPRWFVEKTLNNKETNSDGESEEWSIGDFLYWFEENQREWWWWDSYIDGPDRFVIVVLVQEFSFCHDALVWLIKAAGATDVINENLLDLME